LVSTTLFFSIFSSRFGPTLPSLKGVMFFCFCIKIDPQYFDCYLFSFESFFIWFFFMSFLNLLFCLIYILNLIFIIMIAISFILKHFLNCFFFQLHSLIFGFILILYQIWLSFFSLLFLLFWVAFLLIFFLNLIPQYFVDWELASWFFWVYLLWSNLDLMIQVTGLEG
jgi:hypothetical protein